MKPHTLLLVPGLMCDHAVWAPVLPQLSQGRDCIVVDHGQADSLPAMAQQILATAPPVFAVAGHSMGARVALEVARLAPERVCGLALLSTGYTARAAGQAGEDEAAKRQALLDIARQQGVRAMAAVWLQGMLHPARLSEPVLVEAVTAMFDRKVVGIFAAQIRALLSRPDCTDLLQQITVPTLVLCGRQDSWAPPVQHQAMQSLVHGAVLDIIDDTGHMAPMERPQAVADALLRWLDRLAT